MTAKFWEKFKHKTFCDDRIVMINADCEAVMAEIGDKEVDLILTDPPYGIDYGSQLIKGDFQQNANKHGWKNYGNPQWDKERPKGEIFKSMLRVSKNQIIWGGNYFADLLPAMQCWLVWDKGQREFSLADGEMAWTSFDKAMRIFTYARSKALQDGKVHPTQKPVALMNWCLTNYSKEDDLIFDAFAGSFTTAIACIRTKRRFIGVELDPVYFEKAVERVDTELKQLTLF